MGATKLSKAECLHRARTEKARRRAMRKSVGKCPVCAAVDRAYYLGRNEGYTIGYNAALYGLK